MSQCLSFRLHENFDMIINQSCLKINYSCMHPVDNGKFEYDSLEGNSVLQHDFSNLERYDNMNHGYDLSLTLPYFCAACTKALLCFIAKELD